MSRLYYHEKSDKRKWAAVTIALLLIIAVIITGVLTDWFTVWNKYCIFGHNYDEANVCIRCGKEKPAEEPTPEPEQQPQLTTVAAAANSLSATSSDNGLKPLLQDGSDGSYVAGADIKTSPTSVDWDVTNMTSTINSFSNLVINMSTPTKSVIEIDKSSSFKVGYPYSTAGYDIRIAFRKIGQDWQYVIASTFQMDIYNVSQYPIEDYGVYEVAIVYCGTSTTPAEPVRRSNIVTVRYGVSDLPTAPRKWGYTFTGWYTDEACTQLYTEDYVTSDITLYAGFRAHTYTIAFNANGGTGTMENSNCTYDVEYVLSKCLFERDNYNFIGWATSADGDIVYSDEQTVKNLIRTDNGFVELFAVWELAQVTVSFEWYGDNNEYCVLEQDCIVGQAVELVEEPSKTGYLFIGWQYDDGTMYEGQAITEDTTLTAKFEIIRCTVTFIVDGQVYCVYVCDYGTSIAEALKESDVNTLLYTTGDEHSPNFQ